METKDSFLMKFLVKLAQADRYIEGQGARVFCCWSHYLNDDLMNIVVSYTIVSCIYLLMPKLT